MAALQYRLPSYERLLAFEGDTLGSAIREAMLNSRMVGQPHLGGSRRIARIVPSAELAAAIVLQRHRRIVIMEGCKLSSRRRVEWMACAVLPAPGIVG